MGGPSRRLQRRSRLPPQQLEGRPSSPGRVPVRVDPNSRAEPWPFKPELAQSMNDYRDRAPTRPVSPGPSQQSETGKARVPRQHDRILTPFRVNHECDSDHDQSRPSETPNHWQPERCTAHRRPRRTLMVTLRPAQGLPAAPPGSRRLINRAQYTLYCIITVAKMGRRRRPPRRPRAVASHRQAGVPRQTPAPGDAAERRGLWPSAPSAGPARGGARRQVSW